MSEELENWACAELDSLGLPDASVIIQYLGALENPVEVEDYLNSMLDNTQLKQRNFIREFLERQAESKVDKRFYRKSSLPDDAPVLQLGKKKGKEKNGNQLVGSNGSAKEKKGSKKAANADKENRNDNEVKLAALDTASLQQMQNQGKKGKQSEIKASTPNEMPVPAKIETQTPGKKKLKYVNLYGDKGDNGDVILLSGRHPCECLASSHALINNCLSCGRIVCEQEGPGECLFCGNLVRRKEPIEGSSISTTSAPDKPTKSKPPSVKDVAADIQKAVQHKNKLLHFDQTSAKRTNVFDDENDYFESNSRWLSKSDREKLQARENELKIKKYDRSENKVTIDLLGRKVVVDETHDAGVYDPDDPIVKAILEHEPKDIFAVFERNNVLPPQELLRPVYIEPATSELKAKTQVGRPLKFPTTQNKGLNRLQDRELQEMCDQGKCLSMHQPWASLLISGIKMHEGRSWYSAHRGRLWIASAAKVPVQEEIIATEGYYSSRDGGDQLVFPQHYPPGCLLGCVEVVEVLPREEYAEKYPNGDSEGSAYVFVCKNPQEMIFKFPIKGEHKIFQLDPKIHQAARKALK